MTERFNTATQETGNKESAGQSVSIYENMNPELLAAIDSAAKKVDQEHEAGNTQIPSLDLRSSISRVLSSEDYKGGYKLAHGMNNHELKKFVEGARQETQEREAKQEREEREAKVAELQSIIDAFNSGENYASRRPKLVEALKKSGHETAWRKIYDMNNSDIDKFVADAREGLVELTPKGPDNSEKSEMSEALIDQGVEASVAPRSDDRVSAIMDRMMKKIYEDLNVESRAAELGIHGTYDSPFASYAPVAEVPVALDAEGVAALLPDDNDAKDEPKKSVVEDVDQKVVEEEQAEESASQDEPAPIMQRLSDVDVAAMIQQHIDDANQHRANVIEAFRQSLPVAPSPAPRAPRHRQGGLDAIYDRGILDADDSSVPVYRRGTSVVLEPQIHPDMVGKDGRPLRFSSNVDVDGAIGVDYASQVTRPIRVTSSRPGNHAHEKQRPRRFRRVRRLFGHWSKSKASK